MPYQVQRFRLHLWLNDFGKIPSTNFVNLRESPLRHATYQVLLLLSTATLAYSTCGYSHWIITIGLFKLDLLPTRQFPLSIHGLQLLTATFNWIITN